MGLEGNASLISILFSSRMVKKFGKSPGVRISRENNFFVQCAGSQIVDQFLEAFWLIEESGNFRGEVADSVVGLIVQLLCDYSHYLVENSTSEGSKLDPQKQAHALEPAASHLRRLLTSESEQIRSHAR